MADPHSTRAHSDLPPSSSDKWMFCHGWRATVAAYIQRFGQPPSSAAADEGTRAHEKLEAHLWSTVPDRVAFGEDAKALTVLDEAAKPWVNKIPRPLDPDDDEFDDLMPVVEWIENQPGLLLPETRMDFGEGFGYVGLTGTVDVTLVSAKELTIADLKFGRQIVEVVDEDGRPNTQLMCYLVGAINKFGPRERYRLVILQPRAWHKDGPIRELIVSKATLEVFMYDLEEAIAANYGSGVNRVGPWCRKYCPALPGCRAVIAEGRRRLRETPFTD